MCTLKTEGIQHGCGHYVSQRSTHKDDCGSKYCIWSNRHAQNCPHCPQCSRFLGPDSEEVILARVPDYCRSCTYWWKENNAYRRKD
ncbi:hypothetical protein Agabi119p4_1935 [Agaricus bisporus var. burnettii]|uniref:Uncharacterized protein n=1 Tax=Agaricus bisporus var. burnettii TaxID=192524 RepID=A0A8H7F8H3_AGABI|nr:hypothetical protein Agabi119p4_1935 [Agaricus bisporus var. burnettii]